VALDARSLAASLERDLSAASTPERADKEKAYLKSDLTHLGTPVPAIRKAVRDARRAHPDLDHDDLVAMVTELWSRPVHERRMAAVEFLVIANSLLSEDDIALVEHMIRESRTWALVDTLAVSVTGSLVERHPSLNDVLDRWAGDADFWVRRASLLALLRPLRRGEGDFERFSRYADSMLEEKEFFIRKAIGWVLRETSKKKPDLVYEWIAPRTARASGVTMREATRYLEPDERVKLMEAHKAGRSAI
jgi:3-methyladenine DNA glycosylase AlkD